MKMNSQPSDLLKTLACGLAALEALFLAVFALDAGSFIGLLLHLIPTVLVLGATVFAWNNPGFGAPLLLFLGIISTFHFETYLSLGMFAGFSAPLFLAGVLLLISLAVKKG
jgi:hypothetical protein